jgi:hypothetical protein
VLEQRALTYDYEKIGRGRLTNDVADCEERRHAGAFA